MARRICKISECTQCGRFYQYKHTLYCSPACRRDHLRLHRDAINAKRCASNLQKYGVLYAASAPVIKHRIKQTNIKRYGAENPFASEVVKDKIKQTNMQKYGVPYTASVPAIRRKQHQTNIKRYGTANPFASELIKDKIKRTNLQRYGFERPTQSDVIKQKVKDTNLKRLGVPYPMQSSDVRQKSVDTNLERYGVAYSMQREAVRNASMNTRLITYNGRYNNQTLPDTTIDNLLLFYDDHDRLSDKSIAGKLSMNQPTVSRVLRLNDRPVRHNNQSSVGEEDMAQFLEDNGYNVNRGVRGLLPNARQEIDIYLPDQHVGIEFDGLYWHSEDATLRQKQIDAASIGIFLIRVWEDDWNSKQDIVKSIILAKLKHFDIRIGARSTSRMDLSNVDAKAFFDGNHLNGFVHAKQHIALVHPVYGIVAAVSISKNRFNHDADLELVRFASKQNMQIIGALPKLLHGINASVFTYVDRRYSPIASDATAYASIGNLKGSTGPGYFWWCSKSNVRVSRYNAQRSKLSHMFNEEFLPTLTESDIMHDHGYVREYDSGNWKFVIG